MAMSRLPLLPPASALSALSPPAGRRRRAAALLLTLAVLAVHLVALHSPPPHALPPAAAPVMPVTAVMAVRLREPLEPVAAPPQAAPDPSPPRRVPTRRPAAPPASQAPQAAATAAPPPPVPADASGPPLPWPVYAAVLPPAAIRHFRLQSGNRHGPARLVWSRNAQGYSLSLMAEGGELDGLGAASRGHIGPAGLVPERHVERRRGRDLRATNFDLDTGQVRGSGGGEPHPWPAGGQDRLSWLLQLAAVLQADPARTQPGAQVVLPVAGPRGPAAAWVFAVRGLEDLALADGSSARGLALHRAARHPYDLQIDVWTDPGDHHLPLRIRMAAPPGDWESVWLSQTAP